MNIKKLIVNTYGEKNEASEVKVITVDNFQGEENDIIILSIVRSNAESNIGYLKISNRVNVALSRAKHAMYIFGNSQCLLGYKREDRSD